jgi:ornithine cyclodeaminase/alanine dehydrogenase-like protein (mu-crystallin family)
MTLLLRRSEVTDLLDLPQAMRVLEQTFREQADGKVKQVPPLRFMNRGMRMVVGGLEAQNKNGFRVSVTGGESVALLFEISSGDLISVMGYPFSNLRISATMGLAMDRLSSTDAKSIVLIGSGRLAMPILEPAVAVRSIMNAGVRLQQESEKSRIVRSKGK